MLILALDTASPLCAAALAENGRMLARADDALGKGHSEHLIRQLPALLAQAGRRFSDLDRIGVNIGPGSFTGVRVGVAAARALALALNRPAVGISAFAALKAQAEAALKAAAPLNMGVALNGARGQIYWQYFPAGRAAEAPLACPAAQAAQRLACAIQGGKIGARFCLTGSAAAAAAELLPANLRETVTLLPGGQTADIAIFAALAAAAAPPAAPPAPLYLRPPDAKPQNAQPNAAAMKRQFRAAPQVAAPKAGQKTEPKTEPGAAGKTDAPQ